MLLFYSISQFLFSLIIYQTTFHFTFKHTRWFWITSGNACSTEVKPTSSIFIFLFTGYFWTVFEENTAWVPFDFISSRYQSDTRGQAWITKVCQRSLAAMRNKYTAVHTTVVQSMYLTDRIFYKNKPFCCINLKFSIGTYINFYLLYFCKIKKKILSIPVFQNSRYLILLTIYWYRLRCY